VLRQANEATYDELHFGVFKYNHLLSPFLTNLAILLALHAFDSSKRAPGATVQILKNLTLVNPANLELNKTMHLMSTDTSLFQNTVTAHHYLNSKSVATLSPAIITQN
jgi:hypothetical protein